MDNSRYNEPFKIGEKIKHINFGHGVIENVFDENSETMIQVQFEHFGNKLLHEKYLWTMLFSRDHQTFTYKKRSDKNIIPWIEKKAVSSVKILKLSFLEGKVAFPIKIDGYTRSLDTEVQNSYILPDFEHIKPFFCTVLGKESIKVEISFRAKIDSNDRIREIDILEAKSDDIEKINPDVIKEAQKLYSVDHLFYQDDLPFTDINEELENISDNKDLQDPSVLIEAICEKYEGVKHALELKFLAKRHELNCALKFGRHTGVSSFLFMIRENGSYFLIHEVVDRESATYIWKCPQDDKGLRDKIEEVESLAASFEENTRMIYIKSAPEGFGRINHRYDDRDLGFLEWQKKLLNITHELSKQG